MRDREASISEKLNELERDWKDEQADESPTVTHDDIAEVVSMWTSIPVTRLAATETERLINMEQVLHEKVIGQDEPITLVSKAVRRARAGLKNPRRPTGIFMFLGPTGVGKTLLVRKLAEFMFGSEDALISMICRSSWSALGGPPRRCAAGIYRIRRRRPVTETVRRKSYCVILLDEIEKAHPKSLTFCFRYLMTVILPTPRAQVDFRNAIVAMTSNIGSDLIRQDRSIGFSARSESGQV